MNRLCEFEGNPFPCGEVADFEIRREGLPWHLCRDHADIFHQVAPMCADCGAGEVAYVYRWFCGGAGHLVASTVCADCASVILADDPETVLEEVNA